MPHVEYGHSGQTIPATSKPQKWLGPTPDLNAIQIAERIPVAFPPPFRVINTVRTKAVDNLYHALADDDGRLKVIVEELKLLFRQTYQSACDFIPADLHQFDGVFDEAISSVAPVGSNVAAAPLHVLYRLMLGTHQRKKFSIGAAVLRCMRLMHARNIIGSVHWTSSDGCSLDGHSYRKSTRQVGSTTVRAGEVDRTETVHEDIIHHDHHRHQILSPELFGVAARPDMPRNILDLVRVVPAWIPAAMVYGKEIIHATQTTVHSADKHSVVIESPVPRQMFRFDPAIIFSNFCLARWV
jgi:hypothetical protein